MLPSYDWGVERMETMLVSYKALALLFWAGVAWCFIGAPGDLKS